MIDITGTEFVIGDRVSWLGQDCKVVGYLKHVSGQLKKVYLTPIGSKTILDLETDGKVNVIKL